MMIKRFFEKKVKNTCKLENNLKILANVKIIS